jgi:hypothetical protein
MIHLKKFEGFLDFFKKKDPTIAYNKEYFKHKQDPLFSFTEEQKLDIVDIFVESRDLGLVVDVQSHERIKAITSEFINTKRRTEYITLLNGTNSDLVLISRKPDGLEKKFIITKTLADDIEHLQEYLLPFIIKIDVKDGPSYWTGWNTSDNLSEMIGAECDGITIKVVETK